MKTLSKRVFAVVLATCMAFLLCCSVSAKAFTDVPSSLPTYYKDAINYVSDNGIILGITNSTFEPEQKVNRAMAVTFLFRMSGDTGTYDASQFTDVEQGRYYYNAVGWGVQNGIVSGITSTEFYPMTDVTRQQFLTMLYRFAGYEGYSQTATETITQAADYASVKSFARTAMAWAYTYGIALRNSVTDNIYPNATIARKTMAVFLSRYRRNVEGIVFSRDAFSFNNSSGSFVRNSSTTYLISEKDWSHLEDIASSGDKENLENHKNVHWAGSCFGMSVAVVLDYIGKIDLNGNYCNSVDSMYNIPKPNNLNSSLHFYTTDHLDSTKRISEVESKINLYQNSWYISSLRDWVLYVDRDSGLRSMVADLEHGGIGVFCYTFNRGSTSGGHAVVAYGKPVETSYGYKISLYDNRTINTPRWLQITTAASGWTAEVVYGNTSEEVLRCKFQTNFDAYDVLDIDGDGNSTPTDVESQLDIGEYTTLAICATGNFMITNAQGETLTSTPCDFIGNMNIYGQDFIPYGENAPCVYLLLVEPSESFTCTALDNSQVLSFYLMNEDVSIGQSVDANNEQGWNIVEVFTDGLTSVT